jgi:hypothetical protein
VVALAEGAQARTNLNEITTDELCAWIDLGWKEPHGSYAATERFGAKAFEESNELIEALDAYVADSSPSNHKAASSELVDMLWPTIATTNNAACNLSTALRERLGLYLTGLTYLGPDGFPVLPPWHGVMARAAAKQDALTLADLQAVIDAGFAPQPTPHMIVEHDDVEPELPEDYASLLAMQSRVLHMFAARQHEYGNQAIRIEPDAFVQEGQETVGPAAAEMLLLIAALGRHVLSVSLADLAKLMMGKIGARIANGRVDKSDGARSPELL